MDDNAYLDTIKDINWDTFYQQKMALEALPITYTATRNRKTVCLAEPLPGWRVS